MGEPSGSIGSGTAGYNPSSNVCLGIDFGSLWSFAANVPGSAKWAEHLTSKVGHIYRLACLSDNLVAARAAVQSLGFIATNAVIVKTPHYDLAVKATVVIGRLEMRLADAIKKTGLDY